MALPSGFIEMAENLLGAEAEDFIRALELPPVVSVRLNSRKPSDAFQGATPVKWCDKGVYLPQRPIFTLDPLLHAGAYYVQDASSMIHLEVTRRVLAAFGEYSSSPMCVLDMCAAPGGKTTAMIDALPDGSRVVANEYVGKRAGILRENLTKWGYPDAVVTNRGSEWFASGGEQFDIVAVDAPCSGEGMMRKDEDAVAQWSPELIKECAALQREILSNAVKALKPGGFLIYSTCTFNRIENEENAEFIASELGLIPFDLHFPEEWGIPGGIGTSLPVKRFMPHKTRGEGLFLAVFRKEGDFEPSNLPVGRKETKMTGKPSANERKVTKESKSDKRNQKGKASAKVQTPEPPEIEEILSTDFPLNDFPSAELTLEQALSYLRRESIVLPASVQKGIVIVTYKGLPLGAVKNIGSRANNLYPKNWRIMMR